MIGNTKAHVVDGLTRAVGRTAMARNQMHDRVATGISNGSSDQPSRDAIIAFVA
jgi:hypothetical protein